MITTEYTHNVTIAVPSSLLTEANSLAALMGQNPAGDMITFKIPSYVDNNGVEYSVSHAVIKEVFLEPTVTGELPLDPADPMPEGYDRAAAEEAFDSLNTEGGILMAFNVDPHAQFKQWGLSRIKTEEEV